MTVDLPNDLHESIDAAVRAGQFSSVADAMTHAVRLLPADLSRRSPRPVAAACESNPKTDPLIGSMREDGDLLDEIVTEAYRRRRLEAGRELAP